MALVPWRGKQRGEDPGGVPFAPLTQLRAEMDRLFDRFFGGSWDLARKDVSHPGTWMPSLDVLETDAEVTVRAEVPGVDPKDIDIRVSGQLLTISGEKRETRETKGAGYYHAERSFGSFRRDVQLPAAVDAENITAEHSNGVLQVRMKKKQEAVVKRIPVKPAQD